RSDVHVAGQNLIAWTMVNIQSGSLTPKILDSSTDEPVVHLAQIEYVHLERYAVRGIKSFHLLHVARVQSQCQLLGLTITEIPRDHFRKTGLLRDQDQSEDS